MRAQSPYPNQGAREPAYQNCNCADAELAHRDRGVPVDEPPAPVPAVGPAEGENYVPV